MKCKAFDFLQDRPPKMSNAPQAMRVIKAIVASSCRFARPAPGAGRIVCCQARSVSMPFYAFRNT
jgi:hypothetical protein